MIADTPNPNPNPNTFVPPRFELLRLDVDGGVGRLVLNRPLQLNALSPALMRELIDASRWLAAHSGLRVLVLGGEGRAFCAGFDLDAMRAAGGELDRDSADLGRRMVEAFEAIPAITLAAVNGHCVGGGLLLAGICDLRIAADLAPFERTLQIRDRFLADELAYFDQRSSNEGFLFLLFYFALFIAKETPSFFAIDNIDASLNPKLCSELMGRLVALATKHDKQVIITTHNPAVLDGLDLNDEEQRLLVVGFFVERIIQQRVRFIQRFRFILGFGQQRPKQRHVEWRVLWRQQWHELRRIVGWIERWRIVWWRF